MNGLPNLSRKNYPFVRAFLVRVALECEWIAKRGKLISHFRLDALLKNSICFMISSFYLSVVR